MHMTRGHSIVCSRGVGDGFKTDVYVMECTYLQRGKATSIVFCTRHKFEAKNFCYFQTRILVRKVCEYYVLSSTSIVPCPA